MRECGSSPIYNLPQPHILQTKEYLSLTESPSSAFLHQELLPWNAGHSTHVVHHIKQERVKITRTKFKRTQYEKRITE